MMTYKEVDKKTGKEGSQDIKTDKRNKMIPGDCQIKIVGMLAKCFF